MVRIPIEKARQIADSLIKLEECREISAVKDSMIENQSSQIMIQDQIMQEKDSQIQLWRNSFSASEQKNQNNEIQISGLKKEVKRQKVQKWILFGAAILAGSISTIIAAH